MEYGYTFRSYIIKHRSCYFHKNALKKQKHTHTAATGSQLKLTSGRAPPRQHLGTCCLCAVTCMISPPSALNLKPIWQDATQCWHILIRNSPRQGSQPGTLMSGITSSLLNTHTHAWLVQQASVAASVEERGRGGWSREMAQQRVPRHIKLALRCYQGQQEDRQVSNSGQNNKPHHETETSDFRREDKAEEEIKTKHLHVQYV